MKEISEILAIVKKMIKSLERKNSYDLKTYLNYLYQVRVFLFANNKESLALETYDIGKLLMKKNRSNRQICKKLGYILHMLNKLNHKKSPSLHREMKRSKYQGSLSDEDTLWLLEHDYSMPIVSTWNYRVTV